MREWKCPVRPDGSKDKPPIWYVMMSGSITGIIMWLSIFPLDVVKTQMQSDDLARPKF